MALHPIRFKVANGGYSAGEIAGFKLKTAQHLVRQRFAEFYDPSKESAEVEETEPKAVEEEKKPSKKSASKKKSSKKQLSGGKAAGYVTK